MSLAAFAVVFARVARARGWLGTVVVGWLVCLALDLALSFAPVPVWLALGAALVAAWAGTRLVRAAPVRLFASAEAGSLGLPGQGETAPSSRGTSGSLNLPWWDLPARALATAGLVLALTATAGRLGPDLTGVLAPFPTGTSVVAAFALAQGGPAAAVATMRGVLRGLRGFAAFCFLAAVLAEPIGGWAFAIAVAVAVAVAVQWASRSTQS